MKALKHVNVPCTVRLKSGVSLTADACEIVENGILVKWWDGYRYDDAYLSVDRTPISLVFWEEIESMSHQTREELLSCFLKKSKS